MWAKINNGTVEKYPYTIGDLRADNPNVSFPEQPNQQTLEQYSVVEVAPVDRPVVDENSKYTVEGTPVNSGGTWQQNWLIIDYTQEQIDALRGQAAARARSQRNALLRDCDWTQCSDVVLQNRGEWVVYRQALRDLPDQPGFPATINWPIPPQ